MTVMSEGLLLNVKYIKMGREERFFLSFPHSATSCNVVCHELIIWRLSIYGSAMV